MKRLFYNALIINEGESYKGWLLTNGELIEDLGRGDVPAELLEKLSASAESSEDLEECHLKTTDLQGKWLIPGVIDDHVHFREPGLTHKADIASESLAAAAGGVTSYFEMPNCKPATISQEALDEKYKLAEEKSLVNYTFFPGATNDNIEWLKSLDFSKVPGVKVFLGSSTGNMLVDSDRMLDEVFSLPCVIMVHSEDESIIRSNTEIWRKKFGEMIPIFEHPNIRSREACLKSTTEAVERAKRLGTRLHIAHITTADELFLLESKPLADKKITAEACLLHLRFCDKDYERLGSKIKCNPAVKSESDREALRQALRDGRIDVVATDHAPHLPAEKEGGCLQAASGAPFVQFSLPTMVEMTKQGVFTKEQVVDFMAHNPARLFGIRKRGFLRPGYKADLAIVDPEGVTEINADTIQSKCGWSPLDGETIGARVVETIVNGVTVWPILPTFSPAQPLTFR